MASENISEAQEEEKAALQTPSEDDDVQPQNDLDQKDSKLVLYHWTQSFNSQKVSDSAFQHRLHGQLLITAMIRNMNAFNLQMGYEDAFIYRVLKVTWKNKI